LTKAAAEHVIGQTEGRPLDAAGRLARGIGWLEVVGGLVGCVSLTWYQLAKGGGAARLGAQLLPFGLLISAGIALLRGRQSGLVGSIILQAAQALSWHTAASTWKFCAGPFVTLTFFYDKTSLFVGWESTIAWGVNLQPAHGFVSLNLISCALLWRLSRELNKCRSRASSIEGQPQQ
jgi:hypothetical protein